MSIRKTKWPKALMVFITMLLIFLVIVGAFIYAKQDTIVQGVISSLNKDFSGRLEINDSHISPFANFPYLSIDFEEVQIYEGKSDSSELLLQIKDTYVGFNLLSILNGSYEIKKISLENGYLKLVQHTDGSFNVANALTKKSEDSTTSPGSTHLDLQSVELKNIDLLKINEANDILVETFIESANSSFRSSDKHVAVNLQSQLLFNLILDGDTSFLHDKHLNLQTTLDYDLLSNKLLIAPSKLQVENASFSMEGSIDVMNHMQLDLHFSGNKPNFDLFLAFAPPEIEQVLSRYDNGGSIYFDATVLGRSIDGYSPAIEIDFGCKDAFVKNNEVGKTINDLFFEGHFTNGTNKDASTMELLIKDFSASPETGIFKGNILVNNFDSPEFDIQLLSKFDLNFLSKFLGIKNLEDISGEVALEMNFHDIIDLNNPEKSIERLNESYFTKLVISDLNVNSSVYPLPIRNINVRAEIDGHKAIIEELSGRVGHSDISLSASISDLPAILHHTDKAVEAKLYIISDSIDIKELTASGQDSSKYGFNELITNLSLQLKLNSSARAFTESPHLPVGEFFIEKLHANLNNYPHELHDFNADIIIDSNKFEVIDFTGMLDQSDFHFSGKLDNYGLWFKDEPQGITSLDFNLTSDLLQLEDLFTYGGENYVPEDYRNEEFSGLKLHGIANFGFEEKFTSTHLILDRLEAKLKVHPMKFKEISGEFYMDSMKIEVSDFAGKLGNSDLLINARYYIQADSLNLPHEFHLKSKQLDFDELFAYKGNPADTSLNPQDHEDVFNIFEIPFSNLALTFDLESLNYHRYFINDFYAQGRLKENHYVYIDTVRMNAAGGSIRLSGYFNGSNPKAIYFSPEMRLENIDLDKLLFKFENFGQDHLVSENLHGQLSGSLSGKIHMHADLVPIIDDSELHMDLRVLNGSLTNYSAMEALSDYFADKNLSNVRFDTLNNTLDLKNGKLLIPNMDINSTLGYIEISGEQAIDMNMEYYVKVPLKVVTDAGFSKLFKKEEESDSTFDKIKSKDDYKNSRFLNLKIQGRPEAYRVSLGKK